ncbi:major facilitator superfamily domain-containing protein [Suillus spraguei]|nr:major facilitator superfamily domain-containing protein [Suillus spraguei]
MVWQKILMHPNTNPVVMAAMYHRSLPSQNSSRMQLLMIMKTEKKKYRRLRILCLSWHILEWCLSWAGHGDGGIDVVDGIKQVFDAGTEWQHDPVNPRNWSPASKWATIAILALYTFVTPLASSIMAPSLPDLAIKYDKTNPTVTGSTLSMFLLSFAISPLLTAPLSEVYGPVWVLHLANLFFLVFNLGCALSPNTTSFLIFQLLAGFVGGTPIACGGGIVSDLFSEPDRALATAVYYIGPLIGPVGPVMGRFITESISIQYDFYIVAAICGATAVLGIPFLREFHSPVIRFHRQRMMRDLEKAAGRHPALTAPHMNKWVYFMEQPQTTRIYYLMFTTFPDLFSEVYHFRISKPEMRIPALIFGSLFAPVGLFQYGWSAQAEIHFIMPIIGTSPPYSTISLDTFTYAASATAAAAVTLDYGGCSSFLAGLAIIICVPFSIWIYYARERMHTKSSLTG